MDEALEGPDPTFPPARTGAPEADTARRRRRQREHTRRGQARRGQRVSPPGRPSADEVWLEESELEVLRQFLLLEFGDRRFVSERELEEQLERRVLQEMGIIRRRRQGRPTGVSEE